MTTLTTSYQWLLATTQRLMTVARWLWTAQFASCSGDWTLITAYATILVEPTLVLYNQVAGAVIPIIFGPPIAGFVLRRSPMAWTIFINLLLAVYIASIGLWISTGLPSNNTLMFLNVGIVLLVTLKEPTENNILTTQVEGEDEMHAISRQQNAFQAGRVAVGPLLLVISTLSTSVLFLADAVSFLILPFALYKLSFKITVDPGKIDKKNARIPLLVGVKFAFANRPLLLVLMAYAVHYAGTFTIFPFLPKLTDNNLSIYGWLICCGGSGSILGNRGAARLVRKFPELAPKFFMAALAISPVPMAVMFLVYHGQPLWLLMITYFLTNFLSGPVQLLTMRRCKADPQTGLAQPLYTMFSKGIFQVIRLILVAVLFSWYKLGVVATPGYTAVFSIVANGALLYFGWPIIDREIRKKPAPAVKVVGT